MGDPYAFGHRSVETARLQKALSDAGIDAGTADGIFGTQTKAAVEAAQQRFGEPVTGHPEQPLLVALGLAQAVQAPTSNPISDYLTGLALKVALNTLKGYFPMLSAISGLKTYATGVLMMLIGAADWIGWAIPNTATPSPAAWIVGGLAICFGRAGLAKVVEDVISGLGPK